MLDRWTSLVFLFFVGMVASADRVWGAPDRPEPGAASDLKGKLVLVAVLDAPTLPNRPTAEQRKAAEAQLVKDITAALEKNKLVVRQVVRPTMSQQPMFLVRPGATDVEQALKSLPYREWAAIVFKDGQFQKGLGTNADLVPAPIVRKSWASVPVQMRLRDEELARWRKIPAIRIDYTPPAGFGSGGIANITPTPGTTLLEAFLLTGIPFTGQNEK